MRKKTIRQSAGLLSAAVLLLGALTGCGGTKAIGESEAVPADAPAAATAGGELTSGENTGDTAADGATSIHVVAVGDNLVQECVYNSAKAHAENGEEYNFDYCYDNVKGLIDGDLNIINQEVLICNGDYEITGRDFNFNAPMPLGDEVIDMGFNIITLCNNHLLDKGVGGLTSCLDYWDAQCAKHPDILTYGAYRDYVDMQHIRTKEVNGKTVAFLGYAENLNGYSIPANCELEVAFTTQDDLIQKQIEEAKQIADVVVVTCHWGDEDTYTVRDGVKATAQKIINWGADVIIGTHPHVAQTMEYLTRDDGTQGFVFYSLGNFISAQTDNFNLISELADFQLMVQPDGMVTVENVQVSPIITHYEGSNLSNLRLYPYSMYNDELAAQHGLPYCVSSTGPDYQIWNMAKIKEMFDTSVPEQFRKYD